MVLVTCGVRSLIAASVSGIALCVSMSARAETTAPTTPLPQEAPQAQTAPAPDSQSTQTMQAEPPRDDIVVTARRREERVQDVPASVASISAERVAMAGVTSTSDLAQLTPGVNVVASGVFSQPVIRGVSSTNVLAGDESNVAVYVDGVYMSQMSSNLFKFNNISRIEVLKGPQGTLFGRNATGGAITIVTKTPSFTPTANASIGAGNFGSMDASGYLSTGITNKLAFDVAVLYHNDDGYVRDLIRGGNVATDHFFGVRAKLLYEPTDWATLTLAGDVSTSDNTTDTSSAALDGNTQGRITDPSAPLPTGPYQYLLTVAPVDHVTQKGASLNGEFKLGDVKLTSITAIRSDRVRAVSDTDGSLANIRYTDATQPSNTFTQELQFSSTTHGIEWVAGAYLFHNKVGYAPLITYPQGTITKSTVKTHAIAGFGEATVTPLARFSITAGLRYSFEQKENYGSLNNGPTVDFHDSWGSFTPRVVARYEIPNLLNFYGSYSKGFKSGEYNSATLNGAAVKPETINAYEIGIKTLFPGPWRASAAIYQYDYTDIQVSARLPGNAITQLENAAEARIRGAEFDIDGRVTPSFTVSAGFSYVDAVYTSFPDANVTIPQTTVNAAPATACVMGTGPVVGGNRALICNVSGNQLVRAPKTTTNLLASYKHPLAGGIFDASASALFSASFFWDPLNRLKQPAYKVVNGQIGWTFPGNHVRASIWGENLTNQLYELVVSTSATADWVNYAKPRSYGVKIDYSF